MEKMQLNDDDVKKINDADTFLVFWVTMDPKGENNSAQALVSKNIDDLQKGFIIMLSENENLLDQFQTLLDATRKYKEDNN